MYSGSISAEDSDPLQQPERMMKLQSKTKRPNNTKTVDNTLQVHHYTWRQHYTGIWSAVEAKISIGTALI